MSKLSLILLAPLAITACADAANPDGGSAQIGGAPQQVETGTLPGAAKSTDTRLLNCHLEYESFAPSFTVKTAGTFETTFGQVENQGASASDGAYSLVVSTNPKPPYNLSFIIQIFDDARGTELSYVVLPRPHVGGAFLFEIGAGIPAVTQPDGTVFDHMRAYCSIRMP
jgi:hypothetical protein